MIRIFILCNTATEGTFWHLVCTGHRWADVQRKVHKLHRDPHSSAAGRDLWFDRGACDGVMRLLVDSRN